MSIKKIVSSFTVTGLVIAILGGCTAATPVITERDLDAIKQQQAIMAIHTLKSRYLTFMDKGPGGPGPYADGLIELFSEDAIWEIETNGKVETYRGKDQILKRFKSIEGYFKPYNLRYTKHITTNPELDVDGKKATGRWQLIMIGQQTDKNLNFLIGYYDDIYEENTEGEWKIKMSRVVVGCCEITHR